MTGPSSREVITVLSDGTVALSNGTGLDWVQPNGQLRHQETLLDGKKAAVLAGFPDGFLMQEYALNTLKPVYWVPLRNGKTRFDQKLRVTDRTGVPVNRSYVLRESDVIVWKHKGVLHAFDLKTHKRHHVKTDKDFSPRLFDGLRVLEGGKLYALDGSKYPRHTFRTIIEIREELGFYATGRTTKNGQIEYTFYSVDFRSPNAAPKQLKKFTRGPDLTDAKSSGFFDVRSKQIVTKKGVVVWDGGSWATIPI